ncbi:DUF417 family protein [Sphingomonas montana]|uniref:DUF417 family protein n=1 Tax=Sphingomonas montana TaxID=1843236 RepID=UPI00096E7181|nr:DUF417 family protein [Sphingomonas montana]
MNIANLQPHLDRIGAGILRYSLVLIFLGYGFFKFTAPEAAAIAPLTENSPFFFWLNPLLGQQGGSNLIGIVEIATALAIAVRRPLPLVSAFGSLAAAGALFVTLSFLISTPGLNPTSVDAGFLVKDATLLGAAIWTAGEALRAYLTGPVAVARTVSRPVAA